MTSQAVVRGRPTLLDLAEVERQVRSRDPEMGNSFTKDLQVMAIHGLYAAGEVAGFAGGGMHGYRSLEGTFLGDACFPDVSPAGALRAPSAENHRLAVPAPTIRRSRNQRVELRQGSCGW